MLFSALTATYSARVQRVFDAHTTSSLDSRPPTTIQSKETGDQCLCLENYIGEHFSDIPGGNT